MCMNCGCMRAHDDMGNPEVNITYAVLKRAADANDMSVDKALETIFRTAAKDRAEHADEYGSTTRPTAAPADDHG